MKFFLPMGSQCLVRSVTKGREKGKEEREKEIIFQAKLGVVIVFIV